MSKSGLFAHFGSKQELQLATVEAAARALPRRRARAGQGAPDGAARLRAMAAAYLAYLDSDAYSGGCFWAATSAEYDDRPGPGPRRDRRPPSTPGSASSSARPGSPGSPSPSGSPSSSTRWSWAPTRASGSPATGASSATPANRSRRCWRSCRSERATAAERAGRRLRPPLRRVLVGARLPTGWRCCSPTTSGWSRR